MINNFKVGYVNVHGLKHRLLFDVFDDFLKSYDLTCMCETFISNQDIEPSKLTNDTETIPGYTLVHKIRNFTTEKGGLCIAIKNEIKPYVTHVPCESENLIICKIDKIFLQTEEDIYLACTYIPPENSKYSSVECFFNLENEIINLQSLSSNVLIIGDLNGHTNTKADFLPDNDYEDSHSPEFIEPTHIQHILSDLSLPLTRESKDTHRANSWGNNILDMCINTQLVICNGRFRSTSSECTTIHNTTVDYAICSLDFLKYIKTMRIIDFNNCLSDIHNPIEITMKCFKNKKEQQMQTGTVEYGIEGNKIGNWDQIKVNDFVANIDANKIKIRTDTLLTGFESAENQQERIEDIMTTINNAFVHSGYATFGKKTVTSNNNTKRRQSTQKDKPWYNTICRNKKIIFYKARKNIK